MSDNEKVVRDFIAAWSNLDAEELAGYFTEDGTYHNMMLDPVSGRENLIAFMKSKMKSIGTAGCPPYHLYLSWVDFLPR